MSTNLYFRFWAVPGIKVHIIGGIKLPKFKRHLLNPRIWITQLEEISSSIFFSTLARSSKSWEYARLWGYYSTEDHYNSSYVNRYYIVSEELIQILSKLPKEELNKVHIVCNHYYHIETDSIIDVDNEKNKIITNVTKKAEDIKLLPIEADSLYYIENILNFLSEPNEYYISPNVTLFYYSEENDDYDTSEAFISTTGWFSFHSNSDKNIRKGNFEVKNKEILANSNYKKFDFLYYFQKIFMKNIL